MEFKIQRYLGDLENTTGSEKPPSCDLFQQRIEERRRKKRKGEVEPQQTTESQVNDITEIGKEDTTDGVPKKKKKKKKKLSEIEDNSSTVPPKGIEEAKECADIEEEGDETGFVESPKDCSGNADETDNISKENRTGKEMRELPSDDRSKDNDADSEGKSKDVEENERLESALGKDDDENENMNVDKENASGELNKDEGKRNEPDENYFPILSKQHKTKKEIVKRLLPRWLNEPVYISADIASSKVDLAQVDYLSTNTVNNLKTNHIDFLFPVQSCVISHVLSQKKSLISKFPPRDVCVQAPTGSGKTLAYVLPVVEVLSECIVKQLYCLVIVPSKDLAAQVFKVFTAYVSGTHLKVGITSGLKTFSKEQEKLISPDGGSRVDILVCTPGRLVDHLKQTRGFTLRNLRFLVVDEADRLLGQDYSSWLDEVKKSVYSSNCSGGERRKMNPITVRAFNGCQLPLQKLLFSATLTKNPEKIAPLELYHPVLFTSKQDQNIPIADDLEIDKSKNNEAPAERFILPEKLEEKMIVVEPDQKPLVLAHLMLDLAFRGVLCFTKSIEATHRLCILMQSFGTFSVAEFSSTLSETQRKGIIRDFNNGKVDLVISSDAMARGMDIDTVKLVVNYDTAVNAKTYVHRVGRTARAGKEGCAITVLSRKEVYHFKLMMKKLHDKKITQMPVSKTILNVHEETYKKALQSLQEKITLENKTIAGGASKRT